ncbi:membrane protein FxsA [Halorhabdus sp. CBA1104]|uniref:FxsA family protein n=1 Tax=unclassified Halorhabdus TaxID=2621901 RepID=UPI0012B1EE7A|nr:MULTISPECIES: FxsA family protein [unclassified Halorhabdus]QGN05975.1 membrane protein FxsA [Halorhabdus sp. CBA1104]
MLRLIAVLLLIPLLDMLLLVAVAGVLGVLETVALVVLTGLVGLMLVRAEGRHTLRKIQRKVVEGEAPTDEVLDGALLLVAGAFLLTPGLVTDVLGFIFVVPPTRYPVRVALKKWVVTPYIDNKTGGFATGSVYVGGFPGEGDGNIGGASGPSGPGGPGGPAGAGPDGVRDIGAAEDVDDATDDRRE